MGKKKLLAKRSHLYKHNQNTLPIEGGVTKGLNPKTHQMGVWAAATIKMHHVQFHHPTSEVKKNVAGEKNGCPAFGEKKENL